MKLSEYQTESKKYNLQDWDMKYLLIALSGEVGELCNAYKKQLRGDVTPHLSREHLLSECGDILYYLTRVCEKIGGLEQAALSNIEKIKGRYGGGAA